jgi:hypothetical protein
MVNHSLETAIPNILYALRYNVFGSHKYKMDSSQQVKFEVNSQPFKHWRNT